MKVLIVLSFVICGCVAKESLSKQLKQIGENVKVVEEKLQAIEDQLANISNTQEHFKDMMENKIKRGTWHLGMNINPSDGHTFGYTVGWSTGTDIGSADTALTKDYLSANVWVSPANYIAIVRHQQGVVDAVKVFKFKTEGESLSSRFGLKNMNPGRQIVTLGGPIQQSIAQDAKNLADDPIFSVGGNLVFNWAYGDNGCRIALTGGHLSEANSQDDNTHGLGNDFHVNPLTNTALSTSWPHDISNIQDCPYPACRDVKVQGTDHGPGSHLKTGPVYGNYALYVSLEADKFLEPGHKVGLEIKM